MMIIRPIQRKDYSSVQQFSAESLLGMTNLPRDKERLLKKIVHSENSFLKHVDHPEEEQYYFVLEDLTTGKIGGTCGILSQSNQSFTHCYHIETLISHAKQISTPKEIKALKIISNPPNSSEVCALYLESSFRHSGLGRLLSLSRFLFIAAYRQRFKKRIVAEMRGYINSKQVSPFWEGIGRHFCQLSFVELMEQLDRNHAFIPEILPSYPIYIPLLSQETQEAIGKVHDNTQPAYAMLIQENFTFNQDIDIFEGGPILSATTSAIRSIKSSALITIAITSEPLKENEFYIIGNERLDFRACLGQMQMISKKEAFISEEVANALQVKKGDVVRFVTAHQKPPKKEL